ncbi:hypothetical protein GCM10029963_04920 [Micromonospora andamanensis]
MDGLADRRALQGGDALVELVDAGGDRFPVTAGATITDALPAKATSPTLNSAGRSATNSRAACRAAISRSGGTSSASMERDTSTATMTVARSRGTRTSSVGRAKPTTSSASIAMNSPAGTCRRHAGRAGATLSSRRRLVNRTAYRLCRR